ncbi:translation initiation factor eIF-2B subunit alpha isoform X3 [Engraulis encrasicolus]|uniref:translation initiation factor eIF-2B subunit alpha isoform X3 n=1 Tax=Engraulis encrasicolus TaxID=184585 RepID=UPI002FD0B486
MISRCHYTPDELRKYASTSVPISSDVLQLCRAAGILKKKPHVHRSRRGGVRRSQVPERNSVQRGVLERSASGSSSKASEDWRLAPMRSGTSTQTAASERDLTSRIKSLRLNCPEQTPVAGFRPAPWADLRQKAATSPCSPVGNKTAHGTAASERDLTSRIKSLRLNCPEQTPVTGFRPAPWAHQREKAATSPCSPVGNKTAHVGCAGDAGLCAIEVGELVQGPHTEDRGEPGQRAPHDRLHASLPHHTALHRPGRAHPLRHQR